VTLYRTFFRGPGTVYFGVSPPRFPKNILYPSSGSKSKAVVASFLLVICLICVYVLKMVAEISSEMSVNFTRATRRHIPGDISLLQINMAATYAVHVSLSTRKPTAKQRPSTFSTSKHRSRTLIRALALHAPHTTCCYLSDREAKRRDTLLQNSSFVVQSVFTPNPKGQPDGGQTYILNVFVATPARSQLQVFKPLWSFCTRLYYMCPCISVNLNII
jgi:hypothetical protein